MCLYDIKLLGSEPSRLLKHAVGDCYLSDVVHRSREGKVSDVIPGEDIAVISPLLQLLSENFYIFSGSLDVSSRSLIPVFNQVGKGIDHLLMHHTKLHQGWFLMIEKARK